MRSGDHAYIDLDSVCRADRSNLLLLQHAQQLHLQAHRHVADLVEQQRAAMAAWNRPLWVAMRPGKSAFLVTEQLGLEQVLGHRAAIDRDERRSLRTLAR